jgi:hypothetical protein
VVIISHFDRWLRYTLLTLLVIAIGLMILVIVRIGSMEMMIGEMINESRAVECRGLVIDGVVLDPAGSCYDPDVLKFYDPLTGKSK